MSLYLAIDIGASGGRHMLAKLTDGRMELKEIRRFPNGARPSAEGLLWPAEELFAEVLAGLRDCAEAGFKPDYLGIDTWGVDYALLDKNGARLGPIYSYRNERTEGQPEKVDEILPFAELYARCGIQRQVFNTIYQLTAEQEQHPERLRAAETFLMLPDYLNYLLTGIQAQEYTNATTTSLVRADSRDWDRDLIRRLGLPEKIFLKPRMPGSRLGRLKPEIAADLGFDCEVILPATHDTGSAYVAVPAEREEAAYLSSGTWSLLGCELPEAILNSEAAAANFTNEGGFAGRFRFLKNIMGLWLIQSLRREDGARHSWSEMADMARASSYQGLIDVNEERFLAPASMSEALKEALREGGFPAPASPADLWRCVYRSLALCYREAIADLDRLRGRTSSCLHIVGGGSQNDFLNQLTADACGLPVYAGPVEGTVLGNVLVQMLATGEVQDLGEARAIIRRSFPIKKYEAEVWT